MSLRIYPPGSDTAFDINGAHITAIKDGKATVLRTVGLNVSDEMEAKWYDTKHRAVMNALYALEVALADLNKEA